MPGGTAIQQNEPAGGFASGVSGGGSEVAPGGRVEANEKWSSRFDPDRGDVCEALPLGRFGVIVRVRPRRRARPASADTEAGRSRVENVVVSSFSPVSASTASQRGVVRRRELVEERHRGLRQQHLGWAQALKLARGAASARSASGAGRRWRRLKPEPGRSTPRCRFADSGASRRSSSNAVGEGPGVTMRLTRRSTAAWCRPDRRPARR